MSAMKGGRGGWGRNSLLLAIDAAARGTSTLLIGIWAANHFGASDYGLLNWALGITALISTAGLFGADTIVQSRIAAAEQSTDRSTALSSAIFGHLVVAMPLTSVVWIVCSTCILLDVGAGTAWGLVALLSLRTICQSAAILASARVLEGDSGSVLQARLAANGLGIALKAAVITQDASIAWMAGAIVAETMAETAIMAWRARTHLNGPLRQHLLPCRRDAAESAWITVGTSLVMLAFTADKIILGSIVHSAEVGCYALGVIPSALLISATQSLVTGASAPLAMSRNDPQARIAVCRKVFGRTLLLSVLAAAIICLAAPLAISLAMKPEYHSAIAIVTIQVWSAPLVTFVSLRKKRLNIDGENSAATRYSIIAGVSAVATCAVCIPLWGAVGAAWAAIITWAIPSELAPRVLGRTEDCLSNTLSSLFSRSQGGHTCS